MNINLASKVIVGTALVEIGFACGLMTMDYIISDSLEPAKLDVNIEEPQWEKIPETSNQKNIEIEEPQWEKIPETSNDAEEKIPETSNDAEEKIPETSNDAEEIVVKPVYMTYTYNSESPDAPIGTLNKKIGKVTGPEGIETYYNLDMSGVIDIMKEIGIDYDYWVRDDGVKMYGEYVMVAADLDEHSRGSLVNTSLGKGIVCDTGDFVYTTNVDYDIAVNW